MCKNLRSCNSFPQNPPMAFLLLPLCHYLATVASQLFLWNSSVLHPQHLHRLFSPNGIIFPQRVMDLGLSSVGLPLTIGFLVIPSVNTLFKIITFLYGAAYLPGAIQHIIYTLLFYFDQGSPSPTWGHHRGRDFYRFALSLDSKSADSLDKYFLNKEMSPRFPFWAWWIMCDNYETFLVCKNSCHEYKYKTHP